MHMFMMGYGVREEWPTLPIVSPVPAAVAPLAIRHLSRS